MMATAFKLVAFLALATATQAVLSDQLEKAQSKSLSQQKDATQAKQKEQAQKEMPAVAVAATGAQAQPPAGAQIAPFGREDTAKELQAHAARTQDTLVDAVENAEVAEIKRSVFRALTRLRAAEIKEFDTIARLETQSIDEYNDNHHYRAENPLDYLHSAETAVATDKYTSFHG